MASRLSISSSAGLRPSPRSWRESSSRTVSSRRSTLPAYSCATALWVASESNPVWQAMSKSPSLSSSLAREQQAAIGIDQLHRGLQHHLAHVARVGQRALLLVQPGHLAAQLVRPLALGGVGAFQARAGLHLAHVLVVAVAVGLLALGGLRGLACGALGLVLPPAHQRDHGHGGQEHGHQVVRGVEQRAGQQQDQDQHKPTATAMAAAANQLPTRGSFMAAETTPEPPPGTPPP